MTKLKKIVKKAMLSLSFFVICEFLFHIYIYYLKQKFVDYGKVLHKFKKKK